MRRAPLEPQRRHVFRASTCSRSRPTRFNGPQGQSGVLSRAQRPFASCRADRRRRPGRLYVRAPRIWPRSRVWRGRWSWPAPSQYLAAARVTGLRDRLAAAITGGRSPHDRARRGGPAAAAHPQHRLPRFAVGRAVDGARSGGRFSVGGKRVCCRVLGAEPRRRRAGGVLPRHATGVLQFSPGASSRARPAFLRRRRSSRSSGGSTSSRR